MTPNSGKQGIKILVDSREQKPYKFKNHETEVVGLKIGDYAPAGYESECSIERKSLADWANSITKGRKRFEREIVKAKKELKFFAIIIESDLEKIWTAHLYSQVNRKSLVNAIPFWSVKYNIPIIFGSNRIQSKYLIKEFCKAYILYRENDKYKDVFELVYGGGK